MIVFLGRPDTTGPHFMIGGEFVQEAEFTYKKQARLLRNGVSDFPHSVPKAEMQQRTNINSQVKTYTVNTGVDFNIHISKALTHFVRSKLYFQRFEFWVSQ